MKRVAVIVIVVLVFLVVMGRESSALTFEFNKEKPGMQTFVLKNLQFAAGKENITPVLPTTFYLIYYSTEDIPVLAAKVGKIDKTSAISPYLERISGGGTAKSIPGPHGEKVIYNPNNPPDKKMLSSYALWDEWVFIGNKKETMIELLKSYKTTADVVKVEKSTPSMIKEWKDAGIRLWGDNLNDRLSNLLEAQKKMILVPLIRDPKKIKYIAGAFILTEAKEMSGTLVIVPAGPQAGKDIESDLKFTGETMRRRLVAVKTQYKGKIHSTDNGVVYETYIGNYMAAQGQIVQEER